MKKQKLDFVTKISESNYGIWKYSAIEAINTNQIDLFISHVSDQYNDPKTQQFMINLLGDDLLEKYLSFL
jgi:hypothetical protein